MPRMTLAEYQSYQGRIARDAEKRPAVKAVSARVNRECDLHNFILRECKSRGWLPFHGSMAHATFRTPGEPDFMILASGGRLLMVECKTRDGKLSLDQQSVRAWAAKLGHTVHVVRSEQEFLEVAG